MAAREIGKCAQGAHFGFAPGGPLPPVAWDGECAARILPSGPQVRSAASTPADVLWRWAAEHQLRTGDAGAEPPQAVRQQPGFVT